jgi:hypothetical protein
MQDETLGVYITTVRDCDWAVLSSVPPLPATAVAANFMKLCKIFIHFAQYLVLFHGKMRQSLLYGYQCPLTQRNLEMLYLFNLEAKQWADGDHNSRS